MTAPATERRAHVEPDEPLYPVTYGSEPLCETCFRMRELSWTTDPCDRTRLIYVCAPCAVALANGRGLDLPTGEELAETWRTLARLHQNREIDDLIIGEALGILAWWMPPQTGWERFEALKDALLRVQEIDDGLVDYASEAEWRDPETYEIHCHGLRDEALAALMGARR